MVGAVKQHDSSARDRWVLCFVPFGAIVVEPRRRRTVTVTYLAGAETLALRTIRLSK